MAVVIGGTGPCDSPKNDVGDVDCDCCGWFFDGRGDGLESSGFNELPVRLVETLVCPVTAAALEPLAEKRPPPPPNLEALFAE